MKRALATFTLDYGKCPPWLFSKMAKLGREISRVIIDEFGPDEYVKRLSDPVWFQSLGTVLAFDWNASGLTTILTAALKEAIRGEENSFGVFICGGKGVTSRKTPDEISSWGEKINLEENFVNDLVYTSKMSAKVDSSLVQDGYQLYHHCLIFTKNGNWTVVQQGMNTANKTARRYHWFSEKVDDFVNEPHTGISSQRLNSEMLNLTSSKSRQTRSISYQLINSGKKSLFKDIEIMRKHASKVSKMLAFRYKSDEYVWLKLARNNFRHHAVEYENLWESKYLKRIFDNLTNDKPGNFEGLLATKGVGPKTIRALALVSEVIYGAKPSYEDPARYSFAHGGKDAVPYPVNRKVYNDTIITLRQVVRKSKINIKEKDKILKKLY
jgi:hypothetical protein